MEYTNEKKKTDDTGYDFVYHTFSHSGKYFAALTEDKQLLVFVIMDGLLSLKRTVYVYLHTVSGINDHASGYSRASLGSGALRCATIF